MIKMLSVIIGETTKYEIVFSDLRYQLKQDGDVVFESSDFSEVRDQLLKATGV